MGSELGVRGVWVQVRVSVGEREWWKVLALVGGTSVSDLVREAVLAYESVMTGRGLVLPVKPAVMTDGGSVVAKDSERFGMVAGLREEMVAVEVSEGEAGSEGAVVSEASGAVGDSSAVSSVKGCASHPSAVVKLGARRCWCGRPLS